MPILLIDLTIITRTLSNLTHTSFTYESDTRGYVSLSRLSQGPSGIFTIARRDTGPLVALVGCYFNESNPKGPLGGRMESIINVCMGGTLVIWIPRVHCS